MGPWGGAGGWGEDKNTWHKKGDEDVAFEGDYWMIEVNISDNLISQQLFI